MKRLATGWEKIFANQIPDKSLMCLKYMEKLSKLNKKTT